MKVSLSSTCLGRQPAVEHVVVVVVDVIDRSHCPTSRPFEAIWSVNRGKDEGQCGPLSEHRGPIQDKAVSLMDCY